MATATAPSGFDAIGKPISFKSRQAAYEAVRSDMMPDASVEDAMGLVNRVADRLERDQPFEAMTEATDAGEYGHGGQPGLRLDYTGAIRLFAHLLA